MTDCKSDGKIPQTLGLKANLAILCYNYNVINHSMFIVVTAVISNKSGVFDWPLLPMGDSSSDAVSHGKALIKEEYFL